MKPIDWKDIAELVGITAIVASLIFVGLQMKQSHEIALADIYQARTTMVVEWGNDLASNRLALSAFIKQDAGRIDEIEPLELRAVFFKNYGDLMMLENSHYQFSLGFLPQEHWDRARRNLKSRLTEPLFRQLLSKVLPNMQSSFRAEIEAIQREIASEPGA